LCGSTVEEEGFLESVVVGANPSLLTSGSKTKDQKENCIVLLATRKFIY
jgi:hypothetical protein